MGFCENYDYYGPDWAATWPSGSGGSTLPPHEADLVDLWLPDDIENSGTDITQWVGSVGGNTLTPAGLDNCRPTITTSSWGTPAIQMLDPVNSTDPGNINQCTLELPGPLAGLYLFVVFDHNNNISSGGSELGGTDLHVYDVPRPVFRWAGFTATTVAAMDNLWVSGQQIGGYIVPSDMQGAFGFSIDPNDDALQQGALTSIGSGASDSSPWRIVEVALYNRRLTLAEAQEVIAYYEGKYPRESAGHGYGSGVVANFDYTDFEEGVTEFVSQTLVDGADEYLTNISGRWPNPAGIMVKQNTASRRMVYLNAASNPTYGLGCVTDQDGVDGYYGGVALGLGHVLHVCTFENTSTVAQTNAISFSSGPSIYRQADGSWYNPDGKDLRLDGLQNPQPEVMSAGFHIVDYDLAATDSMDPYRNGSPIAGERAYWYELVFMKDGVSTEEVDAVRQALATKYGVTLS